MRMVALPLASLASLASPASPVAASAAQAQHRADESGICAIDLVGLLYSRCCSVASTCGEAFCDDDTDNVRSLEVAP